MAVAKVLAANIQALFSVRADVANANQLAVKSKEAVNNIRRMVAGESNCRVDTLDAVAKAFRLRACDLLDPSLAERVMTDPDLRLAEARPPVVDQAQWRALSPTVRALTEEVINAAARGALPDDRARHLQETLALVTQARAEDLPPQPTPEGRTAFEEAAREAEQHATTTGRTRHRK